MTADDRAVEPYTHSLFIDLSMDIDSMDRVTRPCANTNEQIRQCFSEINCKKLVVHISCTADDSEVDFTRDRTEEKAQEGWAYVD
jgi:hypothetical protein